MSTFKRYHEAREMYEAYEAAMNEAASPEGRASFAEAAASAKAQMEAIGDPVVRKVIVRKVMVHPPLEQDPNERDLLLAAQVHEEAQVAYDKAMESQAPTQQALAPAAREARRATDGRTTSASSRAPVSKEQRAFRHECDLMRGAMVSSTLRSADSATLRKIVSEIDQLSADARGPIDLAFRLTIVLAKHIAKIEDAGR